jgi:Leucine-rich repeat (LRR) protein
MVSLNSLQKLDLSHNRFAILPDALQHLLQLKKLLISGNIFLNKMDKRTRIMIELFQQKGISIVK